MKSLLLFLLFLIPCGGLKAHEETVVLIHGMLLSKHHMVPLANSMERAGYECVLFQFPSRQKYVCEHAESLNEYLRALAACKPGVPINFVTHSIGGLVLRAALNSPACPSEAKMGKAVLLAPPNQGSLLAREFKNNMVVQMALGSKVGWELMNYEPADYAVCFGHFPSCMKILVVAGTKGIHPYFHGKRNDGLIAVEETALDTFHYQATLCISHGDLIKDKHTARMICRFFLEEQCSSAPCGSPCKNPCDL